MAKQVFTGDPAALAGFSTDITLETTGEITMPRQSAFFAYASNNSGAVTGNDVTLITVQFDSTKFNIGSDFDTTTSTYTAPVTGKYLFNVVLNANGVSAAMTQMGVSLVTSNRSVIFCRINAGAARETIGNTFTSCGSVIIDMDAGDTARVQFFLVNGALAAGYTGDADGQWTSFSGALVC